MVTISGVTLFFTCRRLEIFLFQSKDHFFGRLIFPSGFLLYLAPTSNDDFFAIIL